MIDIRPGKISDLRTCKLLVDQNRDIFGFIMLPILQESIEKNQIIVADDNGRILGFVRYNHKKRGVETRLYDICVSKESQGLGIGKKLIDSLIQSSLDHGKLEILLYCPGGLPSNSFYEHLGFQKGRTISGKRRSLHLWRKVLTDTGQDLLG